MARLSFIMRTTECDKHKSGHVSLVCMLLWYQLRKGGYIGSIRVQSSLRSAEREHGEGRIGRIQGRPTMNGSFPYRVESAQVLRPTKRKIHTYRRGEEERMRCRAEFIGK